MIFLTVLTIAFVIGLVIFFLSRSKKERQGVWSQFFAAGRDSGFSSKETDLLQRLALKCNLPDPNALYRSRRQIDICIRSLAGEIRMSEDNEDRFVLPETQNFLSKLYDFRQKIELEKFRDQEGIKNSRLIGEGQALRILVKGTGVFKSGVIKNTSHYLTISRPTSIKVAPGFPWAGLKITVYLWREDDASYVFDSEVEGEFLSRDVPALRIVHSDSLFRTQKRKSLRIKTRKAAFLYLMAPDERPGRIEVVPGLKCLLEDLSDSGCAVIVGGRATAGLHIKVQFVLGNTPVCMSGTVRSVDISEDGSRSVLHVEADLLSAGTRNRIMAEVFGMFSELENDEESEAV
ncbi:pilus assembly protein PilZ [Spirochaetia bacterium]|nr:pilus assembly protein PilZ [Spirochaetia bacterium]